MFVGGVFMGLLERFCRDIRADFEVVFWKGYWGSFDSVLRSCIVLMGGVDGGFQEVLG